MLIAGELSARLETLENIRAANLGKSIALTTGVYDVVHIGHIEGLKASRAQSDILVVAVTTDCDARQQKGQGRPVFSQVQRMGTLAALRFVDHVVLADAPGLGSIIAALHPDVFIKGKDWEGKPLLEQKALDAVGARIVFTDTSLGSTTAWLNRQVDFGAAYPEATEIWLEQFWKHYTWDDIRKALDAIKEQRVLVLGEGINDIYEIVEPLAKSPRETSISVRSSNEAASHPGGICAVRRHLDSYVRQADTMPQCRPITKIRFLTDHQKLFGVQRLPIPLLDKAEERQLEQFMDAAAPDVVLELDYGHGYWTSRLRSALGRMVRRGVFVGLNVQINSANFGQRLSSGHRRASFRSMNSLEYAAMRRHRWECPIVVTAGQEGARWQAIDGTIVHVPALAQTIADRVGAGDALFAITALLTAAEIRPQLSLFLGSAMAACQCGVLGNERPIDRSHLEMFLKGLRR